MNKVSVVILNWNGVGFLEQFLPFVTKYSDYPGAKVVVADNASSDNSVEFIKKNYPDVELILFNKNYGFAEGYNKALDLLNSEYYVLLNSDVEVTPNWLVPVMDFLENNPQVAAAMPKLLNFADRQSFEYAGAAGGFIDKYGYPFCRGRIFDTIEKDTQQYNDICEIFWATGACMFVKAEVFKKVKGFDPTFFAHMEEIDLCWRMKLNGYKIYYVPDSTVFHVGGGALPKTNPHKTYLNFRNNLFLLYKNLPLKKLNKILLTRFFLDITASVRFIVNFKLKFFYAIFKAYKNFYSNLSYLKSYRKSSSYNEEIEIEGILEKSIVLEYYIKKNRTFNKINN